MAARCPACGKQSDGHFCKWCGSPLPSDASTERPSRRWFGTAGLVTIAAASFIILVFSVIFLFIMINRQPGAGTTASSSLRPEQQGSSALAGTASPAKATSSPGPPGVPTGGPVVTLPTPSVQQTPAQARTVAQILQQTTPSILRIRVGDTEGTGFVALQAGQILTAFHVVGDAAANPVVVASDGTRYQAAVVGADGERDLALLSVPALRTPPLAFASKATVGESVFAVGYAAGLAGDPSVTRGIVSAQRVENGMEYLQTDTPINPGNSGGPLLNERGEVVGVNVGRLVGTRGQYENLGFALSIEEVRRIADSLRAGELRLVSTPTAGPSPTATPRPQPTPTPFVIKEYPENQPDGSVRLVQQWSDGRYTVPIFVLFKSVTSPISKGQAGQATLSTRPGATCQLYISNGGFTVATARADNSGEVRLTWRLPDSPLLRPNAGAPGAGYAIYARCNYGEAKVQDFRYFQVK